MKINRNYSNTDKKTRRVSNCKEIQANEVGNFMTGNREIRLDLELKEKLELFVFHSF